MTQRIGLGQAIIHQPDLILLDEPTSALDPVGRRDVRDLIRSLRADGATVFLNSHLLSEVELICDRVAIVDHGRLVRSGRLADLIEGAPELHLTLDRVDGELKTLLARHGEVLRWTRTRWCCGSPSWSRPPRSPNPSCGAAIDCTGWCPGNGRWRTYSSGWSTGARRERPDHRSAHHSGGAAPTPGAEPARS